MPKINYKKGAKKVCLFLPLFSGFIILFCVLLYSFKVSILSLLVPFLFSIIIILRWFNTVLSDKPESIIVPIYEIPEELSPLETGILVDREINDRDIAAQVIYFVREGVLDIKLEDNEYFLILKKSPSEVEENFNQLLLESIFDNSQKVKFKEVAEKFKRNNLIKFNDFTFEISESLVKKGFYKINFRKRIGNYNAYAASFFIAAIPILFLNIWFVISLILTGLILIFAGRKLPLTTKKGAMTVNKILGFKEYIETSEQARIKFHNDPAKNPENFQKLLPYAMAFGLENKWAKKIKEQNSDIQNDIPLFEDYLEGESLEEKTKKLSEINSHLE